MGKKKVLKNIKKQRNFVEKTMYFLKEMWYTKFSNYYKVRGDFA